MNKFLSDVFSLLNGNTNYAVLRNYEDLPLNPGRDIDIIIDCKDFNRVKNQFLSLISSYGYKVVLYDNRQFMSFFAIGRVPESGVELLSFDFLYSIHLKDFVYLSITDILENRIFNGRIYHVSKPYEFLSKYIYHCILGVEYPSKYRDIYDEVVLKYSKECLVVLNKTFGSKFESLKEVEQLPGKELYHMAKREAWKTSKRNVIKNRIGYYKKCIDRFLFPHGLSIAFTGPDGVGKTTVIDKIIEKFNRVSSTLLLHHRPTLIGNLSNVAHQVGVKKNVDDDYTKPHRGKKNNIFSSFARLLYYSMDYIMGYQIKVRKQLFCGGFVIFDRYYSDIIVDSKRSSIFLGHKFLYYFGRIFIPSLDYNILLTANTDTILARKRELDEEGIRSINEKIDYLADKKGYKKILNEQTPEVAVSEILSYIFECQHKKNLKRLK